MQKIAVYTKNELIYRRIVLITRGVAEVQLSMEYTPSDLAIIDRESFPDLNISGYVIPYSDKNGTIHNLPISHSDLLQAISSIRKVGKRVLSLSPKERCAHLGNRVIKLTELEARLLDELLKSNGFVSREKLLKTVFNDGKDSGIVNVYVHYLREKLEKDGDKVILSSRREGYMIDSRFKEEAE